MRKLALAFLAVSLLAGLAHPETEAGISRVMLAVSTLCVSVRSLLPIVAMLMVVVAGIIYAAGQLLGAETRARANVWATAALTGALIGLLIFAIAPNVLNTIYGGEGGDAVRCEI